MRTVHDSPRLPTLNRLIQPLNCYDIQIDQDAFQLGEMSDKSWLVVYILDVRADLFRSIKCCPPVCRL